MCFSLLGAPADGGDGGDVVLFCDPSMDSLLHLHARDTYTARKGPNGNPEEGSQGSKSLSVSKRQKRSALPCTISVPPGTVVKRKGNGRLVGELLTPGDRLVVAKGGQGGYGTIRPSKRSKQKKKRLKSRNLEPDIDIVELDWREGVKGAEGEQMRLTLMLRIVADVGFVGLPNAGKSSLLAALSRASPEIAPYPFTTLIPNLGVMGAGGDPVLVDLPGLIEGAHVGRGLGRNFLRHLRRTRLLLQVVDGALPDPAGDYLTIRDELRMYNPDYCRRRHLVAITKIDLLPSNQKAEEAIEAVAIAAEKFKQQWPEASLPEAIVTTSAVNDVGIEQLKRTLNEAMLKEQANEDSADEVKNVDIHFHSPLRWEE